MAKGAGFDLDTASLEELEAQRQQIEAKIAALRAERREGVLSQVRELLASIGETPETAFTGRRRSAAAAPRPSSGGGGRIEAKYRDAETGNTWTGRGKQPVWLRERLGQGATLDQFKVG
jgi:DNA-binding protein H-NS